MKKNTQGSKPRRGGKRHRRNYRIFGNTFNAMSTTTLRLCQSQTLSSSAGGVVASIIVNDPFTSSFTEYTSDLVNLYGQFRLLGSRIQLLSLVETKWQTAALAVGYQNRNTGLAAPTGINLVLDNQPSRLWAVSNDSSPYGFRMQQKVDGLLYSATSSSANTSTDSSGAPGGWQVYGGGLPASTAIVFVRFEIFIQFRSRS